MKILEYRIIKSDHIFHIEFHTSGFWGQEVCRVCLFRGSYCLKDHLPKEPFLTKQDAIYVAEKMVANFNETGRLEWENVVFSKVFGSRDGNE